MSCKTFSSILKALFIQRRPISSSKHVKKTWTPQESKKLLDLVEIHGTDWIALQQHFTDRGRKSLGGRYRFLMQSRYKPTKMIF